MGVLWPKGQPEGLNPHPGRKPTRTVQSSWPTLGPPDSNCGSATNLPEHSIPQAGAIPEKAMQVNEKMTDLGGHGSSTTQNEMGMTGLGGEKCTRHCLVNPSWVCHSTQGKHCRSLLEERSRWFRVESSLARASPPGELLQWVGSGRRTTPAVPVLKKQRAAPPSDGASGKGRDARGFVESAASVHKFQGTWSWTKLGLCMRSASLNGLLWHWL